MRKIKIIGSLKNSYANKIKLIHKLKYNWSNIKIRVSDILFIEWCDKMNEKEKAKQIHAF